jgi:hypothetical protein
MTTWRGAVCDCPERNAARETFRPRSVTVRASMPGRLGSGREPWLYRFIRRVKA